MPNDKKNEFAKLFFRFANQSEGEEWKHQLNLIVNKEQAKDLMSGLQSAIDKLGSNPATKGRVFLGIGGIFEKLVDDSYEAVDLSSLNLNP